MQEDDLREPPESADKWSERAQEAAARAEQSNLELNAQYVIGGPGATEQRPESTGFGCTKANDDGSILEQSYHQS